MILNYIWIGFLLIAFAVALIKLLFYGDASAFPEIMNSTFSMAEMGFKLSLGLTGVMTLWLGIMKIGEKGGAMGYLSKAISPFFNKLFPEIPKNSPVHGSMVMNFAANMLGLDNAATPLGLKAMNELQDINPNKEKASNSMIMFLVINTSGLTIIPISLFVYRAQFAAANPTDVFIPVLITTFASTLAGIITVSIYQKINLFNKYILIYLGSISLLIATIIYFALNVSSSKRLNTVSTNAANIILFSIIITFIILAVYRKINVYNTFIEGAKKGFSISIKIIPYLIAVLVAVGAFRASGAMDMLIDGIKWFISLFGIDTKFVDALPVAIMKPLSGSGARGLMAETMSAFGADSFAGRLSCIFQGATDTTFYIIALYFGSVGIKNTRYAITAGLISDFVGIVVAILMCYLFFS